MDTACSGRVPAASGVYVTAKANVLLMVQAMTRVVHGRQRVNGPGQRCDLDGETASFSFPKRNVCMH